MRFDNRPIGIFDSGLGGLSIWKEVTKLLPNESIVYYADSKNCPYGTKSSQEVIKLSENIVEFLINKGVKLIIVACNTATAAAIDHLRSKYDVPFVGLEPAIKPAALNSKNKNVAVLATEGTFNGRLFNETSERFAKDTKVHIIVGEGLVEIVENNLIDEIESKIHVEDLLAPYLISNFDHLVLGCTHYPFLEPIFRKILPANITIIDPSYAVAKQTMSLINKNALKSQAKNQYFKFYTSGDSLIFTDFLKTFYSNEIDVSEVIL